MERETIVYIHDIIVNLPPVSNQEITIAIVYDFMGL